MFASSSNISRSASFATAKQTLRSGGSTSQYRQLSQQNSKQQQGPPLKRGTLRKKIEHDNKLRHAINLYHGSDAFFPTMVTRSGQQRIGMIADEADKQASRLPAWARSSETAAEKQDEAFSSERLASHDEQLDWFIRSKLIEALKVSSTERQPKAIHMRNANMTLAHVEQAQATSGSLSSEDLGTELDRQQRVDHLFNYGQANPNAGKLPPLPARDDVEAIKAYLAEATRKTADVMRQSVGADEGASPTDNRTARVRDALFGTVRGSLPGLEVVRERARDARVRKEAERLAQEEHDRRAGLR